MGVVKTQFGLGRIALARRAGGSHPEAMALATRHQASPAAWSAIERRQYAVASELISRILSDDPHDPEGHRLWGHVLMGRGRHDDAVEAFSHAVTLDLVNPRVHFELAAALIDLAEQGSAFFRDSYWAQATDAAQRGLALDPDDEAGLALLDLIRHRRGVDRVRTADRTSRRIVPPAVGPHAGIDRRSPLPLGLQIVLFVMAVIPAAIYGGLAWSADGLDALTGDRVLATAGLFVLSSLLVRVFLVHPMRERQQTIVLPA